MLSRAAGNLVVHLYYHGLSWTTLQRSLTFLAFLAIYELAIRRYLGDHHPFVIGATFITMGAGLALMLLLWFVRAREEAGMAC